MPVAAETTDQEREVRQEVSTIAQDESVDDQDMSDDDGFQDLETTEGEGVDFLVELLELSGWTQKD